MTRGGYLMKEDVVSKIETMLKENGMWVSQEGWQESDKHDSELLATINYLIRGFQERQKMIRACGCEEE